MARFADERDEELAKLGTELSDARRSLRFDIATIGLVALLAVAVGGPLLVGRGLRPVGKLSDAVSRVSEKDFKLPHDGSNLSVELVPIHGRLTQTLDLLQRAFAREKQAVADISHELRTPIAALMATIDVALRKQRTPDQYRAALEECRMISKQLGQLVERIMTLATLDAGKGHTSSVDVVICVKLDAFARMKLSWMFNPSRVIFGAEGRWPLIDVSCEPLAAVPACRVIRLSGLRPFRGRS
jgi:signal transduction histidine kinase